MRKLYYLSDTHFELRKDKNVDNINVNPENEGRNLLALCGDIGNPFNPSYSKFLERHSKIFEHIFVVSGNHEYYSKNKQYTISEIDEKINEICSQFTNITFLQKSSFLIDDILFIGCTLWTAVDKNAEENMNDYNYIFIDADTEVHSEILPFSMKSSNFGGRSKRRYIKGGRNLVKYNDILSIHKDMKEWIGKQIHESKYKIIVLTHHAPSVLMCAEKSEPNSYLMQSKQDINFDNCYFSPCESFFKSPVICWISGHTHECKKIVINNIPSLSNCYGYPNQNTGFQIDFFEF